MVMVHVGVCWCDGGAGRGGVAELGGEAVAVVVVVGRGGCVRKGDVWRVRRGAQGVAAALSLLQWQGRRCMAAEVREVDQQLCDAARGGDVEGISLALLAGADVNANEGSWRMTPLQSAARNGHVATVEALLAAGAHVDGVDALGWTPLMFAAFTGHAAVVSAQLAAGADVHRVDRGGDKALHWACFHGHVDCARALLDAGARADVRNRHGRRPIDVVSAVLGCVVAVGPCATTRILVACRCVPTTL